MSDQTRTADDLTASHADPYATTGGDTCPPAPPPDPADLTRVYELAAEYHAVIAAGRTPDLADVCGEHPHLLPHVQSVLRAGERVGAVAQTDEPPPRRSFAPGRHSRYVIGEEIARGGMGEVYRATDTVLNREVAVKVLQPKYAPKSTTARRFDDEARITAQLQHPGIPAVHDLGTLPDGRPFLAMKLIKGDTLDRLLKDRDPAKPDLGRFVPVFEQICHALAYAHARGVIHRDLKPANVMVGNFGETQVMDWGLAKVLANRGCQPASTPPDPDATAVPEPTAIKSLRDSDTQAGSILGTPAFMAPEQAIGAVERIDRRTDVFGLGAILAVVLTGRPPYQGETAETTRQLAAMGKVGDCFARLDGCGAEPELVALCKRCLSPDPADRPANAEVVASAVTEHQAAAADRARQAQIDLVRAEGERVRHELRVAERRKRNRVQRALAGAALVIVGGVGAFAWWEDKRASARANELVARQSVAEREAHAAVGEVVTLCDLGNLEIDDPPRWRQTLTAARAAIRRAESAAGGLPASSETSAAVQAAKARLDRDESDCDTAEQIDQFLIAGFNASEVIPPDVEQLKHLVAGLFRRAGVEQRPDLQEWVTAIRTHRLSYRLTILATQAGGTDERQNASVTEQLTRPIKPILSTLYDAGWEGATAKVEALMASAEGRQLSSKELVLASVRMLKCHPQDRRQAGWTSAYSIYPLLLDEAVRRNPRDLYAHLLSQMIVSNQTFRSVRPGGDWADHAFYVKPPEERELKSSAAALCIRPDVPYLWSKHGIALEGNGQTHGAISCYRRATEIDPTRHADTCRIARCLAKQGNYEAAADTCRQVMRGLPPEASVRMNDVRAEATGVLLTAEHLRKKAGGKGRTDAHLAEARGWLSQSLIQWRKELETRPDGSALVAAFVLHSWLTSEAFTTVRATASLKALPNDERVEWERFWAEVRSLAAKAEKAAGLGEGTIVRPDDSDLRPPALPALPPPGGK